MFVRPPTDVERGAVAGVPSAQQTRHLYSYLAIELAAVLVQSRGARFVCRAQGKACHSCSAPFTYSLAVL